MSSDHDVGERSGWNCPGFLDTLKLTAEVILMLRRSWIGSSSRQCSRSALGWLRLTNKRVDGRRLIPGLAGPNATSYRGGVRTISSVRSATSSRKPLSLRVFKLRSRLRTQCVVLFRVSPKIPVPGLRSEHTNNQKPTRSTCAMTVMTKQIRSRETCSGIKVRVLRTNWKRDRGNLNLSLSARQGFAAPTWLPVYDWSH